MGAKYYTDVLYVKYGDVLYNVDLLSKINRNKQYLLLYDTLSVDDVSSLAGNFKCYNECLLYEYDE